MIQRIGIGLLLAALLVPAILVAEQPVANEESNSVDSDRVQPPGIQPSNQVSMKFYRPERVTSALPHWWNNPQRLALPVKHVVKQGAQGQKVIEYNHQPPIDRFLGPGFPIMQEEEPLLGID